MATTKAQLELQIKDLNIQNKKLEEMYDKKVESLIQLNSELDIKQRKIVDLENDLKTGRQKIDELQSQISKLEFGNSQYQEPERLKQHRIAKLEIETEDQAIRLEVIQEEYQWLLDRNLWQRIMNNEKPKAQSFIES